jgi:hypothetical protein
MKTVAWILLALVVVLPAIVGAYSGWSERRDEVKSKSVDSDPICQKKALGFSICELAKAQSENMAKQLPYKVDSNTTISTVESNHNVVSLTVLTEYTQQEIQSELGSNLSEGIKSFSNSQKEIATQSVCNGDKRTRAFVDGGGVIEYQLKYKDIQPLTTYRVENCPVV